MDGRYSFSLTTFNPSGALGQVERALQAAAMGAPLVAVVLPDSIIMASPQVLSSPLIQDDGTSRFARVTKEIVVTHTGLSADGRVLVAAAQRMAVEHEYTFDETIPIELFLEGLSLLFQEYTMKPAARPFGATLVVGYVPSLETRMKMGLAEASASPQLFRVDASGGVESLGNHAVINGNLERTDLLASLKAIADDVASASVEETRQSLVDAFHSGLAEQATRKRQDLPEYTLLTTSLSRDGRFTVDRHEQAASSSSSSVGKE